MNNMTNTDISDQWSNEADYTFDVGILSPTRPPVGLPSAVFSNTWLTNSEVCPATGRPEEKEIRHTQAQIRRGHERKVRSRQIWGSGVAPKLDTGSQPSTLSCSLLQARN